MSEPSVYLDTTEFINALTIKDRRSMVKALGSLAENGNIHAANLYGDFLIQSVWDEEKMTVDLLSEKLLPKPPDPKNDQYLILPRDVQKAIYLYHLASSNHEFDQCPAFKSAKAKLEYCHRKGLAGFNANPLVPRSELDINTKYLLKNYSKNALADSSGQFLCLTDTRPEINNPLNEMFSHFGRVQRDRTVIQISITVFFLAFIKILFSGFRIYLSFIGWFILPLIGCALAFHKFGYAAKIPMCSCSSMKQAYSKKLETLTEECKTKAIPFEAHNVFIRNFAFIKRIWLWLVIVSFIIYLIYLLQTGPSQHLDSLLNFLIAVILSSMFIAWDMKIPKSLEELGQARIIFTLFIGVIFFFFTDNDCKNELENVNKSSDFQRIVDNQIEETAVFILEISDNHIGI